METKKKYIAPAAEAYLLNNLMQLSTQSVLNKDDEFEGMQSKQYEQKSFLWEEEEGI